jgi:hypothetical protein
MHRILSFHNALDNTQAARMLAREAGGACTTVGIYPKFRTKVADGTR